MNETKNTLEQKATSGSAAKTLIRQYMMLIVLLAMIVFFGACNRQFLTWDNLITVTRQVSIIGICATGMMFALLVGHIDLSIGTTVSFSAVLFATLVTDKPEYSLLGFPVNPYLAMLIVLIVCAGLGAIKGSLVVGTNMPALIATLAVSTALEGVNLLITNAMPISGIPESIHWLGRGFLFNAIPMPIVIFLAIVLVAGFILRFTYIGRYIYATGSNTEAARLAGLNVKLIKTAAYMVATCLCAVAGFVLVTRLRTGTHTTGTQYQTQALTACTVGGISMAGGEGGIYNLIVGIFIIGVLTNGMTILGISAYWQYVAQGAILAFSVGMDWYQRTHVKSKLVTSK